MFPLRQKLRLRNFLHQSMYYIIDEIINIEILNIYFSGVHWTDSKGHLRYYTSEAGY